jgi:hypothetical protein
VRLSARPARTELPGWRDGRSNGVSRFDTGSAPVDITVDSLIVITQVGHPYYGETTVVMRLGPDDPPVVIVRHTDGRHWAMAATGITVAVDGAGRAPMGAAPPLRDLACLRQMVRLVAVLRRA